MSAGRALSWLGAAAWLVVALARRARLDAAPVWLPVASASAALLPRSRDGGGRRASFAVPDGAAQVRGGDRLLQQRARGGRAGRACARPGSRTIAAAGLLDARGVLSEGAAVLVFSGSGASPCRAERL